jgi:hypothetical protein
MHLLRAEGRSYRNSPDEIDGLARIILEEEGRHILAWAIDGCVADYAAPKVFTELTAEARIASAAYAKQDSVVVQWMESSMMELEASADIDTLEAFELFAEYLRKQPGRSQSWRLSSFKRALKNSAITWKRLSCRSFAANAVRLQLHALAYNLGNLMRTLAMPKAAKPWSLTGLRGEADQDRRQDGGGSGPTPPRDTHRALALQFIEEHGRVWRYSVDAKRWYRYRTDDGVWRADDSIQDAIGEICRVEGMRILGSITETNTVARHRLLESQGTVTAVRRWLEGTATLMVTETDFDAVPYLLNTELGYVDLRTGMFFEPDPARLFRRKTLIAPDLEGRLAGGHYENLCPRFFAVLRNLANGRDWFIPAVRAWFAYYLTGEIRHQGLLFVQGEPRHRQNADLPGALRPDGQLLSAAARLVHLKERRRCQTLRHGRADGRPHGVQG